MKLVPACDELLKDWRTLGQFHMKPKHFKQVKMSIEGHTNVKRYFFKLVTYVYTLVGQGRSALTRDERYGQLQTVLDEFVDRMTMPDSGESMFHGG